MILIQQEQISTTHKMNPNQFFLFKKLCFYWKNGSLLRTLSLTMVLKPLEA